MSTTQQTTFRHLQKLYATLEEQSVDGTFTGRKVDTYREARLPMAYYSKLFYYLQEMRCIEQVQRGARAQPSIIRMHKPPNEEEFATLYVPAKYRRHLNLTKDRSLGTMLDEIDGIRGRLPDIDLTSWIQSVEERLRKLEGG